MKEKVYIISSCDDEWSSQLEINVVTLSKETAKETLREIILDNVDEESIEEVFETQEEFDEAVEDFVNDLVEDRRNHCSDEFPGINVWCEVHHLI